MSIFNATQIFELVEVSDDGLCFSRGLFLDMQSANKACMEDELISDSHRFEIRLVDVVIFDNKIFVDSGVRIGE